MPVYGIFLSLGFVNTASSDFLIEYSILFLIEIYYFMAQSSRLDHNFLRFKVA